MKISDQIKQDFFSLEKMMERGFWVVPSKGEESLISIMFYDMQKYLKDIYDKIQQLESSNQ